MGRIFAPGLDIALKNASLLQRIKILRMRRLHKIFIFCCLYVTFACPGILCATNIAMVSRMSAIPGEDWIEVKVEVANRGDADALMVFPYLKLGREETILSHATRLEPNSLHRWRHRFEMKSLGFKSGGCYPLFLKTNYHDVNMYPFSMPEVLLLHYKVKPSQPPIKMKLVVGEVRHRGKAEIVLTSTSQDDLSVAVDLFLPNELVSLTPKMQFRLKKGEELSMHFQLENAGALLGSHYKVYAVAQMVRSGIHYTLAIPEFIRVTGYRKTGNTSPWIAGSILFLIILFVATVSFELGLKN